MGDAFHSKMFITLDSLWYEEVRLATFIDWPVKFLSPEDLAANGFYYLRSEDHCACAFCKGIIGAWEEGDSPAREHKKHFPHCPFVLGAPTPNVSLKLGRILSKCSKPTKDSKQGSTSEDICGNKKDVNKPDPKTVVLSSGKALVSSELRSVGLPIYSGPKKKDFITYEARLQSYKNWPTRVPQKPQQFAEAGFYYCGISDHVRCFHCGNGLRNWVADDIPWNEHARWYPDCNFVLLTKGISFIDKVRREKPPYLHRAFSAPSASASTSKPNSVPLSDSELEKLLDLPVTKSVIAMGFTKNIVKAALHSKLQQTGVPFFTTESCIEAVLQLEDSDDTQDIERENANMQEKKLRGIQSAPQSSTGSTNDVVPNTAGNTQNEAAAVGIVPQPVMANVATILPPLPNMLDVTPPLRSSTPTLQVEEASSNASSPAQVIERIENIQSTTTESETPGDDSGQDEVTTRISPSVISSNTPSSIMSSPSTSSTSPHRATFSPIYVFRQNSNNESNSYLDPLIEAEHVIEEADKILGNKPASSDNDEEKSQNGEEAETKSVEMSENLIEDNKALSSEADKLAEELEKLRECRMCRVCMDEEMDIVFLPCTHMVACSSCAVALTVCPICRGSIQYAFKPIIS